MSPCLHLYRPHDRPGKLRCFSVVGAHVFEGTGYTPADAIAAWWRAVTCERSRALTTTLEGNHIMTESIVGNADPLDCTDAPASWAVEVVADSTGKFCGNACRYDTEDAAKMAAQDLFARWMAVRAWRVVPSLDPPTHTADGGRLVRLAA